MKLHSNIQAGARVLRTKRKLPEQRRVLGEAWSSWNCVGTEEENGDVAAQERSSTW